MFTARVGDHASGSFAGGGGALPGSGKLGGVKSRPFVAAMSALVVAGCLGTGTRRVDAPCREMRGSVAREMLRDSREIPVVDVRSSASRRLNGAVEIPLSDLPGRLGELERYRSMPVVVVGDDGDSGRQACELLAGAGFKYVIFVQEGAEGLFAGVRGGVGPDQAPKERP